MPETDTLEL